MECSQACLFPAGSVQSNWPGLEGPGPQQQKDVSTGFPQDFCYSTCRSYDVARLTQRQTGQCQATPYTMSGPDRPSRGAVSLVLGALGDTAPPRGGGTVDPPDGEDPPAAPPVGAPFRGWDIPLRAASPARSALRRSLPIMGPALGSRKRSCCWALFFLACKWFPAIRPANNI